MKESDIKKFKEDYESSSMDHKREIVLGLLGNIREKAKIFDEFYLFIKQYPDQVDPAKLDQIFLAIMVGIYTDSKEKFQESQARLQNIKDTLEQMKIQEQKEKDSENLGKILEDNFSIL